jgi:MbtH protein
MSEDCQDKAFQVVVNEEEQYSIWPVGKEVPRGWRAEGTQGSKEDCVARIDSVWTDMRPLSLRKQMDSLKTAKA